MDEEDDLEAEGALFRREMAGVKRLHHDGVEPYRSAARRRRPPREGRVDAAPPQWSDRSGPVDEARGERLSFLRAGVQRSVARKLRRGAFVPERSLDLHGHTREQARVALALFLERALESGVRCVRVVHGKGHSSPRGPVIKRCVDGWLRQCPEVVAFCSAQPVDGGTGALYVLLKRRRG